MKTILILIFALFFVRLGHSQVADSLPKESIEVLDKNQLEEQIKMEKSFQSGKSPKNHVLKISPFAPSIQWKDPIVHMPMVTYEHQIRPQFTLNLSGFTTVFYHDRILDGAAAINLGYAGGLRYYYNLTNRLVANKPVFKFSADYFSINTGRLDFGDPKDGYYNIVWGVQRSMARFFYYDCSAGFQKNNSDDEGFHLIANLQLGLIF